MATIHPRVHVCGHPHSFPRCQWVFFNLVLADTEVCRCHLLFRFLVTRKLPQSSTDFICSKNLLRVLDAVREEETSWSDSLPELSWELEAEIIHNVHSILGGPGGIRKLYFWVRRESGGPPVRSSFVYDRAASWFKMHGELRQHSSSSISLSLTDGSSQLPSSLAAKHVHCPHCANFNRNYIWYECRPQLEVTLAGFRVKICMGRRLGSGLSFAVLTANSSALHKSYPASGNIWKF